MVSRLGDHRMRPLDPSFERSYLRTSRILLSSADSQQYILTIRIDLMISDMTFTRSSVTCKMRVLQTKKAVVDREVNTQREPIAPKVHEPPAERCLNNQQDEGVSHGNERDERHVLPEENDHKNQFEWSDLGECVTIEPRIEFDAYPEVVNEIESEFDLTSIIRY